MIVGEFRALRPVVEGWVVARVAPKPSNLQFLIDPASEFTLLSARDLGVTFSRLPLDDIVTVATGFSTVPALPQRVSISFLGDDGRYHQEEVHAYIADGPPNSSRLGADVLSHWVTVLDPGSDSVRCEPLDLEPA